MSGLPLRSSIAIKLAMVVAVANVDYLIGRRHRHLEILKPYNLDETSVYTVFMLAFGAQRRAATSFSSSPVPLRVFAERNQKLKKFHNSEEWVPHPKRSSISSQHLPNRYPLPPCPK